MLLGTREWFVVHHTDCGMLTCTDDVMRRLLSSRLRPAVLKQDGWSDPGLGRRSIEGRFVNRLAFPNLPQSVVDDVDRIRHHPLGPGDIPIASDIYDCKTGRLLEVAEATEAGAVR